MECQIKTDSLEFYPEIEIGIDWIKLGKVRVLDDLSFNDFDKEITKLVKMLIDYHYVSRMFLYDDDLFSSIYYDYDFHVATLVFYHDYHEIVVDVLLGEANRLVYTDKPYVMQGEEFDLYIQFR